MAANRRMSFHLTINFLKKVNKFVLVFFSCDFIGKSQKKRKQQYKFKSLKRSNKYLHIEIFVFVGDAT